MSDQMRTCPYDGMRLPEVGRHQAGGLLRVRVFWCHCCEAGVAVVGEGYGSRSVAEIRIDAKTQMFEVRQLHGSDRDLDSVVAALKSGRIPRFGA